MKPYKGVCPECGHQHYGYSRQEAWDYFMRHCAETRNHPVVEPILLRIDTVRYWFWKFSPDKGGIEQRERHAIPEAMKRIENARNIPLG